MYFISDGINCTKHLRNVSVLFIIRKEIVYDLMKYLEKLGLRDFSGISLPDESLSLAFSLPNPVFYNDSKCTAKNNTYFDQLGNLDIKIDKNIFYGGSQHE